MGAKKVLIIDDDQSVQDILALILEAEGYAVVSALDGIAAMQVARQEVPDVIVLDLGLPGADGFLILERMRNSARLARIPVIVLSASDAATNRKRALGCGAVAYLQKPTRKHDLVTAMRQALGGAPAVSSFLRT